MLIRWLIYSLLAFLIGLNMYISFPNMATFIFFIATILVSVYYFFGGLIKELRYRMGIRNY